MNLLICLAVAVAASVRITTLFELDVAAAFVVGTLFGMIGGMVAAILDA